MLIVIYANHSAEPALYEFNGVNKATFPHSGDVRGLLPDRDGACGLRPLPAAVRRERGRPQVVGARGLGAAPGEVRQRGRCPQDTLLQQGAVNLLFS